MRSSKIPFITFSVLLGCSGQDSTVKGVDDYKAEALAAVASYDVRNAIELVGDDSVIFVDVREGEEIVKNGTIKGAVHVSRGLLEFYIDPKSAKYMDTFSSGKKVIFYCATGGRSLLAAKLAKDMGVPDPVYLEGGFKAWLDAGGAIVPSTVTE
jgi:rhodanese-related sulfurtransferase